MATRPYKVICISLYVEDLQELDRKVVELKNNLGVPSANRSAFIRYALSKVSPLEFKQAMTAPAPTSAAKTIEALWDVELLEAVYGGESEVSGPQLTRQLTDHERGKYRHRLKLQGYMVSAELLGVDPCGPPYEVGCPVCFAYALAPCMSEQRREEGDFAPSAHVIAEPHQGRWLMWNENPAGRVKVVRPPLLGEKS